MPKTLKSIHQNSNKIHKFKQEGYKTKLKIRNPNAIVYVQIGGHTRKWTHGSPEEMNHPWIKKNHWYYEEVLPIAARRCCVLNKERVSAVSVHNHNKFVGSHNNSTKFNMYICIY